MKNAIITVLTLSLIALTACSEGDITNDTEDVATGTTTVSQTDTTATTETEQTELPNIIEPPIDSDIVSVSAGNAHSMMLDSDGQLWIWGSNAFGQIGDGNVTTYYTRPFSGYDGSRLTEGNFNPRWNGVPDEDIPVDYDHMRDREFDNDVYTPKIIMENVIFAVARGNSSFAITGDNKLYAWGENYYGQLGDGTTQSRTTPTFIMDDVIYVDSSGSRSLFIKTDNSLWLSKCEDSRDGNDQCILPELVHEDVQKAVFDGTRPPMHDMRGASVLAILTLSGEVISYAETHDPSLLGDEAQSPEGGVGFISNFYRFTDIVDISNGHGQQIFILDKDGSLRATGANGHGSLGIGISGSSNGGDEEYWWRDDFNFVSSNVRKLLSGTIFIKNDSTLYVWDGCGESFNNTYVDSWIGPLIEYGTSPVPILNNIIAAEQGGHYIAFDFDGNVYTWGQNFHGQLGNGNSQSQLEPQIISFE